MIPKYSKIRIRQYFNLLKFPSSRHYRKLGLYFLVIAATLFILMPLYLVAKTAFSPTNEITHYPPILIPRHPTIDNFVRLLKNAQFLRFIQNTVVVGIGTIALTLPTGALAAFALSRFNFPGRRVISQSVLIMYMFPSILLLDRQSSK